MSEIRTAHDVLNFIEEIEATFAPQTWKINDIDIWPVLRVGLYCELTLSMTNIKTKTSKAQNLKRVVNAVLSKFRNSGKPAKILFVSDGISYVNLSSSLYERFCDPMIEIVEEHKKTWLKWNLTGDLSGRWAFSAEKVSGIIDYILISSKLSKMPVTEGLTGLEDLCSFINEKTGNQLHWSVAKINSRFQKILAMENWFSKQLIKIRPSLVVIVGYYSDRSMALIKACKKHGIRSADIQHGIQGELHAAYACWKNVPAQGYNTLPDDFLTWSETENKVISQWAHQSKHKSKVLGNLFEEKWYENNNRVINDLDFDVKKSLKKMRSAKTVLFTMQYGLTYDEWVFKFIANTQQDFNWLIRLHPVINDAENVSRVHNLMKMYNIHNYELECSSSYPLYSILRNINIHVTHSSSTVIEANNFGIDTLLLSEYGATLFTKEIEAGIAHYFLDVNDYTLEILHALFKSSYIDGGANKSKLKNNSEAQTKAYLQTYL